MADEEKERIFEERWMNYRRAFMEGTKKLSNRDITRYVESIMEDQGLAKLGLIDELKIEPMNEAYNGLLETMNNTFDAEINTYSLLLGNPGMGKSSAVYYAYLKCKYNKPTKIAKEWKDHCEAYRTSQLKVLKKQNEENKKWNSKNSKDLHRKILNDEEIDEKISKDVPPFPGSMILVEVDAMLYDKDKKMLSQIIEQFTSFDSKFTFGEKNDYAKLTEYFKKYRVVLYIKNIQVFAEESRQTFLYSFLDHINAFSEKVMIIFSTKNIFFESMLEKRVKSRFSYTAWHFYSLEHDSIIEICRNKFRPGVYPVLRRFFSWIFENEGVKHTLEKFYNLGATLDWFFKIFRTFMMFIERDKIIEFLREHEMIHPAIFEIHEFQKKQERALERI